MPGPLQPWVDWALAGDRSHECAWIAPNRECEWPGALALAFEAQGERHVGDFTLEVEVGADEDVRLPGGPGMFPVDVRVDGRPATLHRDGQGIANVWLARGRHRITGRFELEELPELFLVPQEIALVRLSRDRRAAPVRRNEVGDLWLRSASDEGDGDAEDEPEGLSLEVFRHVRDGSPLVVETRIDVRASGRAREVVLGRAVLEGTTPTHLRSDVAARLDPESGELRIQARPGTFTISVQAIAGTPPETLAAPTQDAPWPAAERWVWQPDEALRQVSVSGAPALDRGRASVPDEWSGTVYALSRGGELTLTTSRRGESTPPPNQIGLQRELWLDFDGGGYTARDSLNGDMAQGYRLELREGQLGRVSIGGHGDQVITEVDGVAGVEVRDHHFFATAELRFEGRGGIPAVGWSEDVNSLSTTLNLPPGWILVTASGADEVSGTWLGKWNLWSIFFVLVISLAIARLANPKLGVLALVALTLCYHEGGAPFATWMFLLPLLALRGVIPAGHLQRIAGFCFWTSVVVMLWVSLPFATGQLRSALYPFTADSHAGWARMGFADQSEPTYHYAEEEPEWLQEDDFEGGRGKRHRGDEGVMGQEAPGRSSNRYAIEGPGDDDVQMAREAASNAGVLSSLSSSDAGWQDPNAIAQTGPGLPSWRFHQHHLEWSGPVLADQQVSFVLVPPWLFRLLALLRVGLLGALLILLLTRHVPTPPAKKKEDEDEEKASKSSAAPAFGAATVLLLLVGAGSAQAQVPTREILDDLSGRLRASPECEANCVLVSDAALRLGEDGQLTIELEVHAGATVGVPLPGPATAWVPERVEVDGRATSALLRSSENVLHARVAAGVHRVTLVGPVRGDALTLALHATPSRTRAEVSGWEVSGIRPDGSGAQTLELRRTIPSAPDPEAAGTEVEAPEREVPLPTWALVRRRLEFGVRWTLRTSVERHPASGGAQTTLRLPLLEGESVTDDGVQVEDGVVVARVPPAGRALHWSSTLELGEALALSAAEDQHVSETWVLACSPIWRCTAEGVTPTSRGDQELAWTFHPWPGETLAIEATRPPGAEGRARTLRRVELQLTPGARSLAARLEAEVSASQGDTQTISLPEGASVQSLRVAGESRSVQLGANGALEVNVPPGESTVVVEWRETGGLGLAFQSPEVALGDPITNASVNIDLPRDRWILWAWGPASGVAVLFWPYLLLVLGIALLLARTKRTPLKAYEWFLLGIGLTQIAPLAALCVIGWFFAIEARGRTPEIGSGLFVFRQIVLGVYTLIAAICLYAALHTGLLMQPDMQVVSAEAGPDQLAWYLDRADDVMPGAGVLSAPLWVWRVLMLGWALWLAVRLFRWGKWAWAHYARGGWFTGGITPAPKPTPAGAPVGAAPVAAAAAAIGHTTVEPEADGDAPVGDGELDPRTEEE